MKRRFLRWLYQSLHNLNYDLGQWLARHDTCEICGKNASDDVCISCDRRFCGECNSYYYNDAPFCSVCRDAMTDEEVKEDYRKYVAEKCEAGCHLKTCPCTLAHEQHTDECAKCNCEEDNSPCNKDCAPSGYTGETVEQ